MKDYIVGGGVVGGGGKTAFAGGGPTTFNLSLKKTDIRCLVDGAAGDVHTILKISHSLPCDCRARIPGIWASALFLRCFTVNPAFLGSF